MSFKVAIASNDGKNIDQHFGQASHFMIFEIKENGGYNFLESRENIPPSDNLENHNIALLDSAKLISDCQTVIASQFGPGAIKVLLSCKIKAYMVSDYVDNALRQLISSELKALSIKDVLSKIAVSI